MLLRQHLIENFFRGASNLHTLRRTSEEEMLSSLRLFIGVIVRRFRLNSAMREFDVSEDLVKNMNSRLACHQA